MDELKICMGGNDEMRKVMKEHSGMLDMFYLNWRWLHKFIWIKMSVLYSIKIKIMKTRKEIIQLNKTAFKITLPTAALLLMEFKHQLSKREITLGFLSHHRLPHEC